MSAKAVTYWQIACDCCGVVCDDYGDFAAWSDPDSAVDNKPDDWMEIDGGDYCAECWAWPEDLPGYVEDESTSDEPVRKHKHKHKHRHTREVGEAGR